jgi:hypothetical protein
MQSFQMNFLDCIMSSVDLVVQRDRLSEEKKTKKKKKKKYCDSQPSEHAPHLLHMSTESPYRYTTLRASER